MLASGVMMFVAALSTAAAAQAQPIGTTRRQSEITREESSATKLAVPLNARTQEELERRVQSLEKQVAELKANEERTQRALMAMQRTVATLQANALPVQRQGSNYIVDVPAGLTLHGANVSIQSDAVVTLKAGAKLDANAPTMNVAAQSLMSLKGATILLNAASNGRGATRSGDQVTCGSHELHAPSQCTLATGSSTVLVGP